MPAHDFLLLPEEGNDYGDYAQYIRDPRATGISDDLILYMMDTLKWIPSINPANRSDGNGFGLNYHGATIINQAGGAKAAQVFDHWASLFRLGPESLTFTGGYAWQEGDSVDSGEYEKFTLPRDSVVASLSEVARMAAAASTGESYLLHIGI